MESVNFRSLFNSPSTRSENQKHFSSNDHVCQSAETSVFRSYNSRDNLTQTTTKTCLCNNNNNDVNDDNVNDRLEHEITHLPYRHSNNRLSSANDCFLHQNEQLSLNRQVTNCEKNKANSEEQSIAINEHRTTYPSPLYENYLSSESSSSTCSISTIIDDSMVNTECLCNRVNNLITSSTNSENMNKIESSKNNNTMCGAQMHCPVSIFNKQDRLRLLRELCTTRGDDSLSLSSYVNSLYYPDVYMSIFYAFRITIMVALPLSLIARMQNLMSIFPAHVVMPLWGIVDCRYTISEQLSAWVLTTQCAISLMILGVLYNSWSLLRHSQAWWCTVIFSSFVLSLFGDVRCKRLVVLISIIMMQMEHLPGGDSLTFPLRVGRDMILATSLALFQSLFPIKYISTECDAVIAKGLMEIVRNLKDATNAFWSDNSVDTALALTKLTTEPLQNIINELPGKFFFIMYEFWESTLRLELRRERLQLIKMFMPHIHTLQDSARSMTAQKSRRNVSYRRDEAYDSQSIYHHHNHNHHHHNHSCNSNHHNHDEHSIDGKQNTKCDKYNYCEEDHAQKRVCASKNKECQGNLETFTHQYGLQDAEAVHDSANLNKRSKTNSTVTTANVNNHNNITTTVSTLKPEQWINDQNNERSWQEEQKEECVVRRHNHYRYNEDDKAFWEYVGSVLRPAVDYHLNCLERVMRELGENLNPEDVARNVSFDDLRQSSADLHAAVQKINYEFLIKANRNVDPLLYIITIFFHHLLVRVAFHVIEYGDKMIDFDRTRYKSQWQRFTEFFFLDYWNKFWEDLPSRLTMATPRDVRIYKDAIKVAFAYGVGVMFTIYTDPENIYYFGMAILFAVGLPTAGDTMIASVYRITGMACACSISYMAIWHTTSLPGELAVALSGIFISLIFRDKGVYAHTAMYCSMLILPSLNSASTKYVLLSRIVSNTFAVMAYYAIVVFIFPIDVLKVSKETYVEALVSVTECFSELVSIISRPFDTASLEEREVVGQAIKQVNANCVAVWSKMESVGVWLPKAVVEPTTHGQPFPVEAMRNAYSSMRRLSSAVEIMSLALQLLFHSYEVQDVSYYNNTYNNINDMDEGSTSSTGSSTKDNNSSSNGTNVRIQIHRRITRKHHAGQILRTIAPTMREIDRRHWIVMRDFITAMVRPYEWSLERATRHLSSFLELNEMLHHTFIYAHTHSIYALRAHYTQQVLHRTMTVAATQQLLPPEILARSFDALTASSLLSQQKQDEYNNLCNTNIDDKQSNIGVNSNSKKVNSCNNMGNHTSSNASEESGVTNGIIARSIASGFAIRRQQEQEHQQQQEEEEEEEEKYSTHQSSHVIASEFSPKITPNTIVSSGIIDDSDKIAENECKDNLPNDYYVFPLPMTSIKKSKAKLEYPESEVQHEAHILKTVETESTPPSPQEIEGVLRDAERQAEQEVYSEYIARRPSAIYTSINPEEAYDEGVHMSNCILVATDIFFAEAERLMKTMFVINQYARSRHREPKEQQKQKTNKFH